MEWVVEQMCYAHLIEQMCYAHLMILVGIMIKGCAIQLRYKISRLLSTASSPCIWLLQRSTWEHWWLFHDPPPQPELQQRL